MVNTRASSKRANSDHDLKPLKKKLKNGRKRKAIESVLKKRSVGFLDLPAELRNRIYDFATETAPICCHDNPPLLIRRNFFNMGAANIWPSQDKSRSLRKFFALTQVSKQIRQEYRPIWLRNSRVRITPSIIQQFLSYFHMSFEDGMHVYQNAPKLLVISWDHDVHDAEGYHVVTPLLKMRANSSTFTAKFVPHAVAEGDFPDDDGFDSDMDEPCEGCWDALVSDGFDPEIDPEIFEEMQCVHREERFKVRYSAWVEAVYEDYEYLEDLNNFLDHANEKWLADIRDGHVTRAGFVVEEDSVTAELHIHLSPKAAAARGDGTMATSAKTLIKSWELEDCAVSGAMKIHISVPTV